MTKKRAKMYWKCCKRCNNFYNSEAKYSKYCPRCHKIRGSDSQKLTK